METTTLLLARHRMADFEREADQARLSRAVTRTGRWPRLPESAARALASLTGRQRQAPARTEAPCW